MKIKELFRRFFAGRKSRQRSKDKSATRAADSATVKAEPTFQPDDSPAGYKTRWHH